MAEQKTYSIKIDGIKQSVDGVESLGSAVNTNVSSIKELRTALKATKDEMAGLDKGTEQWKQLAKVAGDYKDQIDDINQAASRFASDTKALDDAINIGQSMTSVFTLAQGAMSSFGLSTDGVVESIQKLQGAMAIIQSLQSLQNTLKGSTATTDALTKAQLLLSKAMGTGSVAAKTLRGALLAIPLMLIIGLVTELVLHWEDIVGWFEKTFPILNNLTQKISAFGSALKKFMIDLPSQAADVLKKLFSGKFQAAMDSAKNILSNFKDNFWSSYQEEMTVKAAKEGIKRTQQEIAELEIQERNNKTHSKKLIELKKKEFEQRRALAKGNEEELNKIKLDEMKFFADVEDKKTKVAQENAKKRQKIAEEEAKELEKIWDDFYKSQKDGDKVAQEYKKQLDEEELKNKEKLAKAIRKSDEADYKIEKAALELSIEEAEKDEDKIKLKNKLIDLEAEHEKYLLKLATMDELGVSEEEFDQMLSGVKVLTDYQAQVISNMQKGVEVINLGVEKQKKSTKPKEKNKENEHTLTDSWHEFIYGGDGTQDELSSKAQELAEAVGTAYQETIGPVFDGVMNLGDAIHQAMEFAIEEAENALEEAEEMHDEAVEKVSESKDRISDINERMKESSGAQLEAYKTQMADEMLLLQQREQEERRLEKEKEKREKELEKQKKKQRKLELQQQLIQAIVSGALAVVNGLATQPFMPVGIAMGALAGVATAIQIATITKQLSKLADGGLLQGKSHAQGGIPVGSTGIEVEGGEYVVNKRSTAKYLPLLQQINEEGARHKTVANQLGKYADGGQLNYERINSNMDALNTAKIVSTAIGGIEMHPVVSVVDINRGQRNYAEVRQLAGANN